MKKFLLLFAALIFIISAAFSQVIYEDDFDSYNVGDYIAVVNPDFWTTWSNQPGGDEDAMVTDEQSSSPSNSIKVDGITDAVLKMGDKIVGKYKLSFKVYIPAGYGGYYNIQHYESPGIEWAYEVYFGAIGSGYLNAGSEQVTGFDYDHDTWVECVNIIDLDNDWTELYIGGALIYEWPFSWQATSQTGTLQLGGMDVYAGAPTGETPLYYMEDVKYEELPQPLYEDDFESYSVGEYLAVQNPEWWTTWSNAPGGEEDALIVDDQALSGTKSVKVDGLTDLLLKMGDKTSGKFQLKFHYYIPAGYGGYFNIQHFESPGIEWAYEVFFGATGSGYLSAGSEQVAGFDYDPDTWIEIDNIIDVTNDWTELYIDGELLYEWPFSWQYNTQSGTLQLGALDVWAGAPTGETPLYYMDDIEYIQLEGGLGAPIIGVDPAIIYETLNSGTTSSQSLSISNTGELDLEYGIVVTYPDNNKNSKSISPTTGNTKVILTNVSQDPVSKPGGSPVPGDDVVLHYDGDNASAIGLTNGGAMRCAAVFTLNEVGNYIGMELTSIDVYINEAPIATKVQVYNYGLTSIPGPGELILEQDFSSAATAWNTIILNDLVVISGGDIWVGYWVDHNAGTFPAGVDGGPHHPNGDWISTGPGWHHLSDNAALDFNWNIRATLTGDPIIQWLSVSSTSGTVAVGEIDEVDVNFDATELEVGSYYGELVINNNDPNNPQVIVNVNLGVLTGIDEVEKTAVMLYPNPAVNFFNIKSDHEILTVELMNIMGQRILLEQVNAQSHQINTSELQSGIYIIKVVTENGTYSSRISID